MSLSEMFIKGKPIRFRYTAWMLALSNAYVYAFALYTRKSNKEKTSESSLGLIGNVVVGLLQIVKKEYHAVYIDNFFASFNLLAYLNDTGYYACGTMRENRTGNCSLVDKKVVGKKERGWYELWFEENKQVCFIRWNGNQAVTMGSNFLAVDLVGHVSHFSRKEIKIQVSQHHKKTSHNNIFFQFQKNCMKLWSQNQKKYPMTMN